MLIFKVLNQIALYQFPCHSDKHSLYTTLCKYHITWRITWWHHLALKAALIMVSGSLHQLLYYSSSLHITEMFCTRLSEAKQNSKHFDINGFSGRLVFTQRKRTTRKWLIQLLYSCCEVQLVSVKRHREKYESSQHIIHPGKSQSKL